MQAMRILCITNQLPYPIKSGASLRSYNLLYRMAKEHDIYLVALSGLEDQGANVAHLQAFCQEVIGVIHKRQRGWGSIWKLFKHSWKKNPPNLSLAFSEELFQEIQNLVDRIDFDVVQIEHGSMGLYLEALPSILRKRTAWILHDIDFEQLKQISRLDPGMVTKISTATLSVIMKKWQPNFAEMFGLCVVMSKNDQKLLLSAKNGLRVEVSPNGVDTKRYQTIPYKSKIPTLLFVGNMGYHPNADAAIYFCRKVLPLIREKVPNVELWIVGIAPDISVKHLRSDRVFVTGYVPDLLPYYSKSTVCIAPIRAGSGTRLKILEAMAIGRPVVSTTTGCEGLDVIDGEHILIADDGALFAEQTVNLLTDSARRAKLIEKAREYVILSHDWDFIARKLLAAFSEMAIQAGKIEYR